MFGAVLTALRQTGSCAQLGVTTAVWPVLVARRAPAQPITQREAVRGARGSWEPRAALLTGEQGRVLYEDGTIIGGLYAAGNTTSSVMGRAYLGPGSALGSAPAFACLAKLPP